MAVDYNVLLYRKLEKENKAFTDDLKTKTPEQIIEAAYEKVFKEDILSIFEHKDFSQTEAKALYKLKNPLDDLYQAWLNREVSYMNLLHDTVDLRIQSAVKEMKARQENCR